MIRAFVTGPLARRLVDGVARRRGPDVVIGGREWPYLLRWWVIPRNPVFNVYLHCFRRSDDDRALHDHPWVNISLLLRGRYVEHSIAQGGINRRRERRAGDLKLRAARAAHRLELIDGECWTLFVTGPRVRAWGFHCPGGWTPWQTFTAASDPGATGQGCGDA